ncbi:Transcription initiation factor TFIID subunit 2 [Hypsibius exemplaris]|uniref:Transcription initiation factor TFIID subunit 2 n=1 Tax=Hypsibius exemplaris TaxID=2072580 RepID=A0A9X6NQ77_HYPEX|nr:Transcription initiation factor TFIID subunit 2 [Hypsibius exemplaris]
MEKISSPRRSLNKPRPFRLLHQLLAITDIDFLNKRIVGYTELQLRLLQPDVREIHLNCKQCKVFRVTINDETEAEYSLVDPMLDICQTETKKRNLDFLSNCHAVAVKAVNADRAGGELKITLPDYFPSSRANTADCNVITIGIEFVLDAPAAGLYFVVPPFDCEKTPAQRGAYLISGGPESSSRLWFPCVESYAEICPWKIEVTVDTDMTAVSCGDLGQTVLTPDSKQRTFHYSLSVPVCASHIALAVGPFEVLTDPNRNEMVHYCLPKLMPLVKHSTSYLHEAFEFCEEYLSCRYPYNTYRQVFVDQTFTDLASYATVSVINCSYLFPKSVLEQNVPSRSLMALAAYRQFFGMYLTPKSWDDYWISFGITEYLHGLYYRKQFGTNEHRCLVYEKMKSITTFEHENYPIVLVPPKEPAYVNANFHFQPLFPQTCPEEYNQMRAVKAGLVIRMLEERIGPQMLAQVLNKMLSLAATAAVAADHDAWAGLLLTTDDLIKSINLLTAKEINPFFDKWVFTGGHARFKGRFTHNRKRNTLELELTQELGTKGCLLYSGPFPLAVQELDGCTKHTLQIEEHILKYDIACQSKTRRHKKKRIPIWTGEDVDVDLNEADPDSPVLWIKFDSDMTLIRTIAIEQPDSHLLFVARHDRDVIAQLTAIEALEAFKTPQTKAAFVTILENEKLFYRLRLAAAESLARISNDLVLSGIPWSSPPPMYALFKKNYFVRLPSTAANGAPIASNIVKQNDFHDLVRYYLQKKLPVCMARIRNSHNVCPSEIVTVLLDLWKYNENRRNFYSDAYYRAALIEAMGDTFTESAGTLSMSDDPKMQFEQLSNLTKSCLENIFRALNQDKYLPSYHYVVTIACLGAFRKLHRQGVLPVEWCVKLYKDYTDPLLFRAVRIAAFGHLVDHLQVTAKLFPNRDLLDFLLSSAKMDHDPFIQHNIIRLIIEKPPFVKETSKPEDCALSSEALVEQLWAWISTGVPHDSRLRCDLVDLYFTFYGRKRPGPVPIPDLGMVLNLKDRKTVLSDHGMAVQAELDGKPSTATATPAEEVKIFPESREILPLPDGESDRSVMQASVEFAHGISVEVTASADKPSADRKRSHDDGEAGEDQGRSHKKKKKHKEHREHKEHKEHREHKKHKKHKKDAGRDEEDPLGSGQSY